MSNLAKKLRDFVFVWGTLSGVSIWVADRLGVSCDDCLEIYAVEIGVAVLSIVTSAIIWITVNWKFDRVETSFDAKISEVQVSLLKADVDRFWRENRDKELLTEDDMKYVHMLKEKIGLYGVNSFTQRKVDALMEKGIE